MRKIKLLFKQFLIKLLFGSSPKIIIASTGRAGSTMLTKAISESLIISHYSWIKNFGLLKKTHNLICTYAVRISDCGHGPERIWKTHDLYEDHLPENTKCIFVYGEPLESALSVLKMIKEKDHQWFKRHQQHLRATGDLSDLFKKDVLNYEQQMISWMTSSRKDILCIDFENLWSNVEELSDFCGFDVMLPPQLDRTAKEIPTDINNCLFERLNKLKDELKHSYLKR